MTYLNDILVGASFDAARNAAKKSVDEVRAAHERHTDAELVASFLKGDGESFAALVDRHMPMVYKFSYRYMGNADAASDVAQEVFIKVWKNIKKFDREKSFKTWILAITKNTALDAIKKKKAVPFSRIEEGENDLDAFLAPYVPAEDLPDETLQKKQDKDGLERVLGELSPSYRNVLLLRYTEHLKFREIAETLQEPIDTIKSKHRRALIQLRQLLAAKGKGIA
ncbi:MAG TPA: RNA polymerase sigma factor [Candidatus Paceibacterota bacterium]|nr:RNA polymerase sigma factor [Candidatus Paceibacterota bacterium]